MNARILSRSLCALFALGSYFAQVSSAAPPPAGSTPDRPDHARCATWSHRQTVGEEAWTSTAHEGAIRGGPCAHTPVGPPPNPQIGSSWDWYIWRLNGFPEADLRSCTVRGMGDHCYVVVEDTQWNVNVDQTQVDTIVEAFENSSIGPFPTQGIWDLDTLHFGQPPDVIDADPRVYILYYDFDVNSDGFFWSFDQECDDVAQFNSNECDVVYMNCSDNDPAGSFLLAVLAHEFEHLIHHNQDPNEEPWVDEGLAELAMWLYGDPDPIVQFPGNPDRQLNSFSGNFYDYVKTYLWFLYFYERYGGQPAIFSLTSKAQNGIPGHEAVLDEFLYTENFVDVFADWVVANYLDDTTIGDGRYGYVGETLPPFNPFVTISAYPAGPNSAVVSHYAADYARYINATGLQTTFDGVDNTSFRVRALLLDSVAPTQIVPMTLALGTNVGSLTLPQVGTTHDEAVLVYAGASGAGGTTYNYGATQGAVDVAVGAQNDGFALDVHGSVGASPRFVLSIPADAAASTTRLEIFDVTGRTVRRLIDGAGITGKREVSWDGRDDSGSSVASAPYFVRLQCGENEARARVMLRR